MNGRLLLTLNPGSATVKIGVFTLDGKGSRRIGKGVVDFGASPLVLRLEGERGAVIPLRAGVTRDLRAVLEATLHCLGDQFPMGDLAAIGHRVVHGGDRFAGPARIDDATLKAIADLAPLAPLHQPQSLRLIRAIHQLRPRLLQTASFDTAFHRSQDALARRFALPRALHDDGIKRYGFHGLSYKFIARELARLAPGIAKARVVMAHLGSGASLCALSGGESRDTSMGFSALDGIPMSTRCGALDPGVLLYLMARKRMDGAQIEDLLYRRSGLLGVSGISGDSRALLASRAPEAAEALALFSFRVAQEVAALATTIGGLDALVFTAGIGEHQPEIRAAICRRLAWLGLALDPTANAANRRELHADGSRAAIFMLPTDEEQIIADEALSLLHLPGDGI